MAVRRGFWVICGAIAVAVCAFVSTAHAASKHDKALSRGEALFYDANYEEMLFVCEELAGNEAAPSAVRVGALKLVAYGYLLLGSKEQAAEAWTRLLGIDPDYRLDPVEEAPEFVEFFNAIPPPTADPSEKPPDATTTEETTETTDPKRGEAPVETDERGCGVALCLVPLGVGQFTNGQIVKGVIFAVLEPVFLALNIAFWAMNESIPRNADGTFPNDQLAAANERYNLQMAFFGLTLGTTLVGIVDAFLFY